jgi:hypothetical protein
MYELPRTIPDVKMLLALAPEELASTILFLLKKRNEAKFHTGNLQRDSSPASKMRKMRLKNSRK